MGPIQEGTQIKFGEPPPRIHLGVCVLKKKKKTRIPFSGCFKAKNQRDKPGDFGPIMVSLCCSQVCSPQNMTLICLVSVGNPLCTGVCWERKHHEFSVTHTQTKQVFTSGGCLLQLAPSRPPRSVDRGDQLHLPENATRSERISSSAKLTPGENGLDATAKECVF